MYANTMHTHHTCFETTYTFEDVFNTFTMKTIESVSF